MTVSELHTGLEMTHRKGGRLGTHLLRLGFVEEQALLEALEEQFGVKGVSEDELDNVADSIRSLVPPEISRRFGAVAVGRTGNILEVAMVNPLDLSAREAIATETKMEVRPRVASEVAIRRHAGSTGEEVQQGDRGSRKRSRRVPPPQAWEGFWSLPPADSEQFRRVRTAPHLEPAPLLVTFPQLTTLVGGGMEGPDATLDRAAYLSRVQAVVHRDQVADLLMRHLAHHLGRVALFIVHKNRVVGWSARGEGVLVDDIQSLIIPLDRPSIFLNLQHTGQFYLGPIPPGEANKVLAESLGEPRPEEVLALPVRIKRRPVMYAFGDSVGMRLADVPVQDLADACSKAGLALEVLILRSKIAE